MYLDLRHVLTLRLVGFISSLFTLTSNDARSCKTIPGDESWPSAATWARLNDSIDGRLIRTIPLGQPCHGPAYNASQCAEIRMQWNSSALHVKSSSSAMTPFFANRSCDPFAPRDEKCDIGAYVQYSVNVSTPDHIYKTLDFVKTHNIRFVLRNTGHDFMGKSTGANALAIWTHFLQETQWIEDFRSPSYRGPAVKAQAGVSAGLLYEQADSRGYAIVGGQCPGVGMAGGYTQGGGHSVLGSLYGLGADQTLSFEVITTEGEFLVASPTQNRDLYWALSGGGGGTYGIVWSATIKAHKDSPMTAALLEFTSENISTDTYWEAINAYQASTPSYTTVGGFALAYYTARSFEMKPLVFPNFTADAAATLVQPLLSRLDTLGINYTYSLTTYPSYFTTTRSIAALQDHNVGMWHWGGRLLPASLWADPRSFARLTRVIRAIIEDGGEAYDVGFRPTLRAAGYPDNAVLPAWRDSERLFIAMLPWDNRATWDEILQAREKITWTFGEPLRQLTPGGGTYLNEADTSEPDWKTAFYGENYARLLAIKDRFDPEQLLYGSTAVGGDRWIEGEEGRLCPA
ncbi:hypothetical protein B0H15DRAFT_1021003 [Mycena belliarum]|uniref:FAD-binding PCMH-type domain-containing protein n=1 Tax=Mycena belliarum TaxID=1033014 RepID=A0AAD6UCA6_9AGAR|nr:hypothetical protein B0H15DRAFT_1021003 [Mycena belliae]